MPQTVRVEVKGLKELGERMRGLSEDMQKRVARKAVRAGAKIVSDAAKRKAPVLTGNLKAAIGLRRSRRDSKPGVEIWRVGVNTITKKYVNNARNRASGRAGKKYKVAGPQYYWLFQEFGSVHQPARPFFRPAFDQNKGTAAAKIIDQVRLGVLERK